MGLETETIDNLKIVDEEDGTTVAARGVVSTNGDAAVIYDLTIWRDDQGREVRRKLVQKDRISEGALKRGKTVSHLSGISEHLVRKMGIRREDARVNYKLLHGKAEPVTTEVV